MPLSALCATACLVVVVALAGCGGGGGGGGTASADPPVAGGGSSGGSGNPAVPSPAPSLLPTAPTPGAVLYADATALRPLRPGAIWRYRGKFSAHAGAAAVAYVNDVTHSAETGGGVLESEANAFNDGASSETLRTAGGSVVVPIAINFAGKGAAEQLQLIELRSPVRQDDQWVLHEKRYTDTDIDGDLDGKPDALEVVLYSRVLGKEDITLPGLPALSAVRIETVLAQRVQYSSDSRFSEVFRSKGQVWYSPGIGVVRATFEARGSNGTETSQEELEFWDAGNTGFGVMPPQPGTAAPERGELRAISLQAVYAFPNHVLVLAEGNTLASSLVTQRYDLRGQFLGGSIVPQESNIRLRGQQWVQLSDALATVDVPPGGSFTHRRLTVLNADGTLRGPSGGVLLDLGGTRLVAVIESMQLAGAGDRFWVIWRRFFRDTDVSFSIRTEVVLRSFDLQGQALSPERILSIFDFQGQPLAHAGALNLPGPTLPGLSARDGQVLLTWIGQAPQFDLMTASLSASGQLVPRVVYTGLPGDRSPPRPYVLDEGGLLLWPFGLGSGMLQDFWAGLRLDGSFVAQHGGTEPSAERFLDQPTANFSAGSAQVVAQSTRLALVDYDAKLSFQPTDERVFAGRLTWLDIPPGTPLNRAATHQIRGHFGGDLALYPDRALLFNGPQVTLVWLKSGG